MTKCWYPGIHTIDWNNFEQEVKDAYEQFVDDFVTNKPVFRGIVVSSRKNPIQKDRYYTFNHIITKDYDNINSKNSSHYNSREPDGNRISRIHLIKLLIENCDCNKSCIDCEGILMWEEEYKNTIRVNLLYPAESYLVVLEKVKDKDLYILITAYYLEKDYELRRKMNRYNESNNKI